MKSLGQNPSDSELQDMVSPHSNWNDSLHSGLSGAKLCAFVQINEVDVDHSGSIDFDGTYHVLSIAHPQWLPRN